MFLVLTLVVSSLLSNCVAKNNTDLKLQINITERTYLPSSNKLSFKAECRVPTNESLSITWYLRKFVDNSTDQKHDLGDQHIPTSDVKIFENYIVGYTNMSISVEVDEIKLICVVSGFIGIDKLLFRYSNHQVAGANTIIFSNLTFDTTNKVDVTVKTSESFNVSWNIDDAILLPGDTKDNIKVLYPEILDRNSHIIPLLFSPLRISDVKRKYILILDFPISGYSAQYIIYIEENRSSGIFQDPIFSYIIGLFVGILATAMTVLVWRCCCRKSLPISNQRDDTKPLALNIQKTKSLENSSHQTNNEINLSNPLSTFNKCVDKELNKETKEISENVYYSVPYAAVKKKDDLAKSSAKRYQNSRLYHNVEKALNDNN